MVHQFNIGDTVYIVNRTMTGTFFLEGKAQVIRQLAHENRYAVRFIAGNGKPAKQAHERFADPDAQNEPQAFIDQMNQKLNEP